MATNLIIRFRREADPTAATILVNGAQIFSGVLGTGTIIGETFETDPLPISLNPGQTGSMSIAVTSGILKCGGVYSDVANYPDFRVNNTELINGQPPEWPATPVDPMPGGTAEDPDWNGWYHDVGAGETFTCNISVPQSGDYIVFDSQPSSMSPGTTGTFQISIPAINPEFPLPRSVVWQVVNQTTQDSDFVATTGTVEFLTANSAVSITTSNIASAGVFSVRLLSTSLATVLGQSNSVNIS